MRKSICALLAILLSAQLRSQLSGIVNVPSTYTSLASVISAVNQLGASGPLTINIAAGYTETVINGGYSLTATGSSTSPIFFQKTGLGANPLLVAYSGGSGTPGSMNQDGVWRLIGCDYVTIDGIDILDPNSGNPATMEFGYGLFKAGASDGCQNNCIKNCFITLNRVNNSGGSGPAADGTRGIDVVNALASVHNAVISVVSSSGSNSNNKFYSNTIQNCNIGISLVGFADTPPFSFADTGNDVGGNSISSGNTLIDFGGGGSANAAAAIRTFAQYNLNVSYNLINNNTGAGLNHPTIIRGIYLNAAAGANVTVSHNTLTLHGGAISSQLSVIENASGSGGTSNTVAITDNLIINCTNTLSVSGPFYGIWNVASPETLNIDNNLFLNNSTSASSGSTYLIYNNGAVSSLASINSNTLGFTYSGQAAYSGNLYAVHNGNGAPTTTLSMSNNVFSNFNHYGYTGTGGIYFIQNTNDCAVASFNNNSWNGIFLNHSGAEYLINNNSSTQSILNVNNNSISGGYTRTAASGAMYLYYCSASSPSGCVQDFTGNNFSGITSAISGTGNFYGIYNADGATNPYPKKNVYNNNISNILINSTGTFYGYYFDNLGNGTASSGSAVYSNTLSNVSRAGTIYGVYISGAVSPNHAPLVYSNTIQNLNSTGISSSIYAAYLGGGGVGLHFYRNKISDITQNGTSGVVHGIYITSAANTTLSNNFIGNMYATNSSASNAVNGIYISGGALINLYYNTVCLNAISTGGNFNSNALYSATSASLSLRNNIFVNLSSGGTGIAAAYRRSSTSLTNYLPASNNNLFYAGIPGPSNVILQSGSTSYQTLSSFQTAVSPRDVASVSQNPAFLSTTGSSANFLRLTPNIYTPAESGAVNIAGITDDYDGQIRQGNPGYTGSGSSPDTGADEYDQNLNPCTGATAGTIFPATYSLCAGQSASLISNGYTPGVGLAHQWKISTFPGGPYSNISSGIGYTTPEIVSSALTAGTYYFVMVTTCTSIPLSTTSTEATVVVNPIPVALAGAGSTLVCAGSVISLAGNASPVINYQWIGPAGFNSTLQNPVISNVSALSSGIYYFSASANSCTSPQSSVAVSVSDVTLSLFASATGLCLGNTATLSLVTSAITYTWSTNSNSTSIIVTPSVNTIYTVAVTNTANCIVTRSIAVSVINPSINANSTVACESFVNATLSVNAFSPSLVSWFSSPASTLVLGTGTNYNVNSSVSITYYAEATNSLSGCQSARVPVTLTISPNPTLLVTATPSVLCPGKSSTLTATGATTFSWTGVGSGSVRVVSPSASQVYTVTGKDLYNCVATETILINTYTVPAITAMQTATSVCPSSVVGFTASGANSYFWNTGANGPVTTVTPAINTTYTVYGTNTQSCTSTNTLAVITRSVPVIAIDQSTTTVCPGEPVTFTASGAASYTWLPGNFISSTCSVFPKVSAVYNAIGKSINTCTSVGIAAITVDPCTSMMKMESHSPGIKIFPNPSEGLVTILSDVETEMRAEIFSSQGELVFKFTTLSNGTIDLSDLSAGIYFIKIKRGDLIFFYRFMLH